MFRLMLLGLLGAGLSWPAQAATEISPPVPATVCPVPENAAPLDEVARKDRQFHQGQCLAGQGLHLEAAQVFAELLADEDVPRVRFELAKSQLQTGQLVEGQANFRHALASQPPAEVVALIEGELAAAGLSPEADPRAGEAFPSRQAYGYARVARGYDTNINQGPQSATVMLIGLPFQLGAESLPIADWGTQLQASVGLRIDSGTPVSLDLQASVDTTLFDHNAEWNPVTGSLSATASRSAGAVTHSLSLTEVVAARGHRLTQRSTLGSYALRVIPEGFADKLMLSGSVSPGRSKYYGDEGYAARLLTEALEASAYLRAEADGHTLLQLRLARTHETAPLAVNSFREWSRGVTLTDVRKVAPGIPLAGGRPLELSGSLAQQLRRYGERSLVFGDLREDNVWQASLSAGLTLPQGVLSLSVSGLTNRSSLAVYASKELKAQLGWTYAW